MATTRHRVIETDIMDSNILMIAYSSNGRPLGAYTLLLTEKFSSRIIQGLGLQSITCNQAF